MKALFFLVIVGFCCKLHAQSTPIDSMALATAYYSQALNYKNGIGVQLDYAKAYDLVQKAAGLGDSQSQYALGYFHYKGLGCRQDYQKAAELFLKGALKGRDNSMYFYGLCFRNGYGRDKNLDSAQYWLSKSASMGYLQAIQELSKVDGENSNDQAKSLAQQIRNAAIPSKIFVNKYNRISHHLSSEEIVDGDYNGYILQYDWSGQNVISSKKLNLNLVRKGNSLVGKWTEEDSHSVDIRASLVADSLVFNNASYHRRDHYSLDSAIYYQIQSGTLNLVQKGDSVFLAGNIQMFSPQRNEPSKPVFIVLSASKKGIDNESEVEKTRIVNVYPNPFSRQINVDFELSRSCNVEVQLMTLKGTVIYRNPGGTLEAGSYSLPLMAGELSSGIYLVKLLYGKKEQVLKIVKE